MIHYIQMHILQTLLYSKNLKFSEIKPEEIESNLFTFHLNKVVEQGLVEQNSEKLYLLTPKGKEFANRFDIDSDYSAKQAKLSVIMCPTRNNRSELLIYTRKKHPFFDHQGFPTGKVKLGESILEAAARELEEETGLTGTGNLFRIQHYRNYSPKTKKLIEDKVMYTIEFSDPKGVFKPDLEEGLYEWVKAEDLGKYISKPFNGFYDVIESLLNQDGSIEFVEEEFHPEWF